MSRYTNESLMNPFLTLIQSDVNECFANNGGCEDLCSNTIGSYLCSCSASGYYLDTNKHNCSGM